MPPQKEIQFLFFLMKSVAARYRMSVGSKYKIHLSNIRVQQHQNVSVEISWTASSSNCIEHPWDSTFKQHVVLCLEKPR